MGETEKTIIDNKEELIENININDDTISISNINYINKTPINGFSGIIIDRIKTPPEISSLSDYKIKIHNTDFNCYIHFGSHKYMEIFNLYDVTFKNEVTFEGATFYKKTSFIRITFEKCARFNNGTFKKEVNFHGTHFGTNDSISKNEFKNCTFERQANFSGATFSKSTIFKNCIFKDKCDLRSAIFNKDVKFENCTFEGDTNFTRATLNKHIKFINCKFKDTVKYIGIQTSNETELDFTNSTVYNLFILGTEDNSHIELSNNINFDGFKTHTNSIVRIRGINNVNGNKGYLNFKDSFIQGLIDFQNIYISEINLNGAVVAGRIVEIELNVQKASNRYTYRLLKNESLKENNTIKALEYKSHEMNSYMKELGINNKIYSIISLAPIVIVKLLSYHIYALIILAIFIILIFYIFGDEISLFLNKVSNNHGTNLIRGIVFSLSIATIFTLLLFDVSDSLTLDFSRKGFDFALKTYVTFLNITNWKDLPFDDSGICSSLIFVGRILLGFGYYQTAQAFRKFGKK